MNNGNLDGTTLVLGDGGWGQALAMALHRAGRTVTVWGYQKDYVAEVARTRDNHRYLPGVPVPEEITWTADRDQAVDDMVECYTVIPTQFLRAAVESFGARLDRVRLVSASKGLELGTLLQPTEILRDALGGCNAGLAVLSGPSHAEEVGRGLATTVVIAAEDPLLAEHVQARINSESFRTYSSTDLVGVELGGALKNIIAVAAGVADGIGLGDNAKAALVARGLVEMARFGEVRGASRETFFGLSGAGDLMVTCYSKHSRNRSLGERVGKGETLEQILAQSDKVAEGVWTCQAIHESATDLGIEMPITAQLYSVLFDQQDPRTAVSGLMNRPVRSELDSSNA